MSNHPIDRIKFVASHYYGLIVKSRYLLLRGYTLQCHAACVRRHTHYCYNIQRPFQLVQRVKIAGWLQVTGLIIFHYCTLTRCAMSVILRSLTVGGKMYYYLDTSDEKRRRPTTNRTTFLPHSYKST